MLALSLVFGIVWGFVAKSIATKKHRDGLSWFCTGFFFGVIGVIVAACVKPLPDPQEQAQLSAW